MNENSGDSVFERAEEILASALERPEEAREGFVAAECDGDAEVAREVQSLLAGHAARSLPDELDARRAAELVESSVDGSLEGWRIGPYRLVREIGRGGMGAVYLAERADGAFEQQVALKLIKRGMDSEAILERFLRERQILAGLEHPNIAHLLDGGVAEDGRPYLVMEHVPGRTLLDYCAEEQVALDGKLDLFAEVCRAVQHAHRNLVVHRDLKPSNVLVTEKGRVKLLDFGVAKLLDESGDALATALTQAGAGGLTPQYAAPEQVRGEAITTATDVYALGLMLYELLTGELPYTIEASDAERVICNTDPIAPSRAVAGDRLDARRLQRRLSGDLDTIILKALRKETERRYASAEALLEDLRRHRSGLPVEARGDTVGYRASRFVQRHKVGVAAAALITVSLATGLSAALWQAEIARSERDQAQHEADRAEWVSGFMVELFQLADPTHSRGATITVREMLDRGKDRLDEELESQPELQAELLLNVGEAYYGLGLYEDALRLWERRLNLLEGRFGDVDPEASSTMMRIAKALDDLGRYPDSERMARRSLAAWRGLADADPMVEVSLLDRIAYSAFLQGKPQVAEPLLRQALEILDASAAHDPHQRTVVLNTLGHVHRSQGASEEAEAIHRQILEIRRRHWGSSHPEVANTLVNLGAALADQDRLDEAESFYREGLAMRRATQGDEHPEIGVDLAGLAEVLRRKEALPASIEIYQDALARQRQGLPPDHPIIADTLLGLGEALLDDGRYEGALSVLTEADGLLRARSAAGDRRLERARILLAQARSLSE